MIGGDRRLTPAALQSFRLTKHQVVNEKSKKDGLSPILAASTNGHVDVVRCLVKNSANINDLNPEGQTPLILAAKNGFQPLLRLLVNYGAKLDIQDAKGRTALMYALADGYVDLARCLMDAGASQKPVDREGKTALFVAAECGHVAIVEHLLMESGAQDLDARDKQGRTVLMMLARAGKTWPIYKYISESQLADMINDRDAAGWTPLLHAASAGKFFMGGRLLGWGADPTAVTAQDQTAVMLACQRPQVRCASADADFGSSPAESGTPEAWDQKAFVSTMLERSVALDAVDRSGRTALFYAAEFAELEMVRHLLSLEDGLLKPDGRDAKENSVLHAAARMGREEVVRYLIGLPELAALIDEPNSTGDVPIRLAVMSKCLRTVQALIEGGASLKKANSCREQPLLCLASESGAEAIVVFLLDNGFSPDSTDSEGVTALMAATRSDHITIVELLLKASASVNLMSSKGFTALTMAVQTVNIAMCKSLLNHKANPNLLPDTKLDVKTPCSIAAILDNCVLMELLIQYDSSPYLMDPLGRNALYYCVLLGRIGPLKLVMKWAGPEEVEPFFPYNGHQHTLLTIATEKGYVEVVKLLFQAQPTPETKASTGESPLHIACRRQDFTLVALHLTYTMKPNCPRDGDHFTPLMIACQLGCSEIALELCMNGADVNIRTPDGYTALILSIQGNESPIDRVPLISLLIEYNATFDSPIDEKLLGKEVWDLLKTLGKARGQRQTQGRENGALQQSSTPLSQPTQRQKKAQAQTQTKDQAKTKTPGPMKTEERLMMKLKNKRRQMPDWLKMRTNETETQKKESVAARSSLIREEMRTSVDFTEKSVKRLANMIKKHVETTALPNPMAEENGTKAAMEMKHQDITRLYRRPFVLTLEQMNNHKLIRDFSTSMDKIRKEIVRKFEEKLDAMCRRRPRSQLSTKGNRKLASNHADGSPILESDQENDSETLPKNRRRGRRVELRVLYQLKYESKAAKQPSKGLLGSALLKRLSTLKAIKRGRKWHLPRFWELARVRKLARRHMVPLLRQLENANHKSEEELIDQFSVVKLDCLPVAVDEATVGWAPLPALCHTLSTNRAPWWSWLPDVREVTSRRETRRGARLKRLLAQLQSDGSRCSLLLRWGEHQTDTLKLAISWKDRQAQMDMSCAIQPTQFQSRETPSKRPDVVAKLSVDTGRWLWDARELRVLSDALASAAGDKDHDTKWGYRRCLDTLTRRQTYHLLSTTTPGKPEELDFVALHPALSAKLAAVVLHTKLNKGFGAPYTFHGDDVLLYHQPNQKEVKRVQDLLGPSRIKLFEAHRFN